ncbi:Hypothetical protein AT6N2_L0732 [Agrobacterium tumefaciens]|nr:Hypothetical protein AT6N2_L0732 [Agrobacterium tumefaciens]
MSLQAEFGTHNGSAAGRAQDRNSAIVSLNDLLHQVQAEAASRRPWSQAVEGFEDAIALLRGYARTVVLNLEAGTCHAQNDMVPAVLDRVLDKVRHYPLDRTRVTTKH